MQWQKEKGDNAMAKRKRTDNAMAKRKGQTNNTIIII
jgi:hypothetical protein